MSNRSQSRCHRQRRRVHGWLAAAVAQPRCKNPGRTGQQQLSGPLRATGCFSWAGNRSGAGSVLSIHGRVALAGTGSGGNAFPGALPASALAGEYPANRIITRWPWKNPGRGAPTAPTRARYFMTQMHRAMDSALADVEVALGCRRRPSPAAANWPQVQTGHHWGVKAGMRRLRLGMTAVSIALVTQGRWMGGPRDR